MVKIKILNTVKEFMPYFQMVEYEKQFRYFNSEHNKAVLNEDSDWNIRFFRNNATFFNEQIKILTQIIYN